MHFLVLPFLTLSYGGNETDWLLSLLLLLLTRILILSFFVDSFWRWQSLKRNSSLKLFGSDLDSCPGPGQINTQRMFPVPVHIELFGCIYKIEL